MLCHRGVCKMGHPLLLVRSCCSGGKFGGVFVGRGYRGHMTCHFQYFLEYLRILKFPAGYPSLNININGIFMFEIQEISLVASNV